MGKSVLFKRLPKILVDTGGSQGFKDLERGGCEFRDQQQFLESSWDQEGRERGRGGGLEAAVISRARSECQPAEQSMVAEQSSRTGCCCWALARTLRGAKHLGLHVKLVKV